MPDDNRFNLVIPQSIPSDSQSDLILAIPESFNEDPFDEPLKNTPVQHVTYSNDNELNVKEDTPNSHVNPWIGELGYNTDPTLWPSVINRALTGGWQAMWGFLGGLATNPPKDPEVEKAQVFDRPTNININKPFTFSQKKEVYEKFAKGDEWFEEGLNKIAPFDPKYAQSFWVSDVPTAFGQTFGFMATGYMLGPVAPFITGSRVQSYYQGKEALEYGADEDILKKTEFLGSLIGLSEGLPIAYSFKKLGKLGKLLEGELNTKIGMKPWIRATGFSLGQGIEEGAQEYGQTIAENFTAQELYDASRDIFEGTTRGGGAGFISGMGLQLLMSAARIKMHSMRSNKEEKQKAKETFDYIRNGLENNIREITKQQTQLQNTDYTSDIIQTYNIVQDFGSNSKPTSSGNDSKLYNAGIEHMQEGEIESIANTFEKLKSYEEPNLIDAVVALGQENARKFYEGINKDNPKKVIANKHIVRQDNLFGLPTSTIQQLNKATYNSALEAGVANNIIGQVNLEELKPLLNKEQYQELLNDMTVATALNFGDNGLELLRQKWQTALGDKADLIHEITSQLVQFNSENKQDVLNKINETVAIQVPQIQDAMLVELNKDLASERDALLTDLKVLDIGRGIVWEVDGWHGSPHQFDKFSKEKIGTGEGTQAYGHGLYFSSRKEIAEWYAKKLVKDTPDIVEWVEEDKEKEFIAIGEELKKLQVASNIAERSQNIKELENISKQYQAMVEIQNTIFNKFAKVVHPSRNLYKVKLWEGKEQKLFDWDKIWTPRDIENIKEVIPNISEDAIKELKGLQQHIYDIEQRDLNGGDIYSALWRGFVKQKGFGPGTNQYAQKEASKSLNEAGFDGIVYQGATSEEINYVIFDESAIKIDEHLSFEPEFGDILRQSTNFKGYVAIQDDPSFKKGSPEGDAKDAAMRQVSQGAIVELASDRPSSSLTTLQQLGDPQFNSKVIMLARNSELRGQPLKEVTKIQISKFAKSPIVEFVVGDMPNVDSQFIDYLQEIGAKFTIYHTGTTPRLNLGVANKEMLKANENQGQSQVSYGELLKDFKGSTVKELFDYLKSKSLAETEEFSGIEKLVYELVGDYPILQEDIGNNRGGFDGLSISINPNAFTKDGTVKRNPYRTLLHEATHGLLRQFLRSNTPKSILFKRRVQNVINEVRKYMDKGPVALSDINANNLNRADLLNFYKAEIDYYTQDVEEFIAGLMSDTAIIRLVLNEMKISGTSMRGTNMFTSLINTMAAGLQKTFGVGKGSRSLFDEFMELFKIATPEIIQEHKSRLSSKFRITDPELRSRFLSKLFVTEEGENQEEYSTEEDDSMDDEDHTDSDLSDDDASHEELLSLISVINYLSKVSGMEVVDFNERIKNMNKDQFTKYLDKEVLKTPSSKTEFDGKLNSLWNTNYKHIYNKFDKFKEEFLSSIVNRAQNMELIEHISVTIDQSTDNLYPSVPTVTKLPTKFKNTEGAWVNSIKPHIALQDYIPVLAKYANIDPSQIGIAYINDFIVKDATGKTRSYNLQSTRRTPLGKDKEYSVGMFQDLVSGLNGTPYYFIGHFAGKNTLPLIKSEVSLDNFIKELDSAYSKISKEYAEETKSSSLAFKAPYLLQMFLEDIWYGANIERNQNTNELVIESKIINQDFNKIFKRKMKWVHKQTSIDQSKERLGSLYDHLPIGIVWDEQHRLCARTAILDEADLDLPITIEDYEGNPISTTIRALLRTEKFDKSVTDGGSIYLMKSFDTIYRLVHALTKPGVMKNVISSIPEMKALLMKHAMFGISPRSLLGRWMVKNNISLLSTDGATKIGKEGYGAIRLTELQEGILRDDERVFNLPFERIHRQKEFNNIKLLSGRPRQLFNGSGTDVNSNIAYQEADPKKELNSIIRGLMRNNAKINKNIYDNITHKEILDVLKEIVNNPKSPAEAAVSKVVSNLMIDNQLTFDQDFKFIIHHPFISQYLRNKLGKPFANMLSDNIPGARATIVPCMGYLNERAEVESVTNDANLNTMLITEGSKTLLSQAIPEEDVRTEVLRLIQTQRDIATMRYKAFVNGTSYNMEIQEANKEIQRIKGFFRVKLDEMYSEEGKLAKREGNLTDQEQKQWEQLVKDIKRFEQGIESYVHFVDESNQEVYKWKKKRIKEIIDPKTGRIRDGWILISQDIANREGLKAGDRTINAVTPTDLALAVSATRIAGIMSCYGPNRVCDPDVVILNPEYIEGMVGKDNDGDTISIMGYNSDYWDMDLGEGTVNAFDKFWDITAKVKDKYLEQITKSVQANIPANNLPVDPKTGEFIPINKETVFDEHVRLKYNQEMMGSEGNYEKKVFKPYGKDFYFINEAYATSDIGIVVAERLHHIFLSYLNFSTAITVNKKPIILNIRHDKWFDTHTLHGFLTHDFVDWPNNVNKLFYHSKVDTPEYKKAMFRHMFGLSKEEIELIPTLLIDAWSEFRVTMFGPIFRLLRATSNFYSLVQLDSQVRQTLEDLRNNNWESLISQYISDQRRRLKEQFERKVRSGWDPVNASQDMEKIYYVVELKIKYLEAFLKAAKVDNIDNHPALSKLDLFGANSVPVPGSTLETFLINQAQAVLGVISEHPSIADVYNATLKQKEGFLKNLYTYGNRGSKYYQDLTDDYTSFPVDDVTITTSRLTEYVDFSLKRKEAKKLLVPPEQSLDIIKREAIAVNQAMDEIASNENTGFEFELNKIARARVFPLLFERLLQKPIISGVIGGKFGAITPNGDQLVIGLNNYGRLGFVYKGERLTQSQVRDGATNLAAELRNLLTKRENNIWNNYQNRYFMSHSQSVYKKDGSSWNNGLGISTKDNLSLDDRDIIFRQVLSEDLYSGKFSRTEEKLFWLSLIPQGSLSLSKDRKAMGLTGFTFKDETNPLKYSNNGLVLQLLSEYEPNLADSYWRHFSRFSSTNPVDRPDKIGYIRDGLVFEPMEFTENDAPNQANELQESIYDYMKAITEGFRPRRSNILEYRRIKKLLKGKTTEEQVNVIHNELKTLFRDVEVLEALLTEGENGFQVVKDVKKLSKSAFEQKYRKIIPAKIDAKLTQLLERLDLIIDEKVHNVLGAAKTTSIKELLEVDLPHSVKRGLALYWILVRDTEKSLRRDSKDPLRKSDLMRNFWIDRWSWQTWGRKYERKIFGREFLNEDIGFVLTDQAMYPRTINHEEVAESLNTLLHKTHKQFGIATLSYYKAQHLNITLSKWGSELGRQFEEADNLVALLSSKENRDKFKKDHGAVSSIHEGRLPFILRQLNDTGDIADQPIWEIRTALVNGIESFEKDLGILIIYDEAHDNKIAYKRGSNIYDNEYDLIEQEFPNQSGAARLAILSAMQYRYAYDILVPQYLQTAINYLDVTLEKVTALRDYVSAREVKAMRDKLFKTFKSLGKRKGSYYPHQMPQGAYKDYWVNKNLGYKLKTIQQLAAIERIRRDKGLNYHKELGDASPMQLLQLTQKEIERNWTRYYGGNTGPYIIPHFLERVEEFPELYNKVEPQVNYNYSSEFIKGLKNDLLKADFFLMRRIGQLSGESPRLIQKMYHWYADQMQDKSMHTYPIKFDEIKPGMAIQFYSNMYIGSEDPSDPELSNLQPASVWGTIKKVTSEGIELDIDTYNVLNSVDKDLDRYAKTSYNISALPDFVQARVCTEKQIQTLKNLALQGYVPEDIMTRVHFLTIMEANQEIMHALFRIRENPSLLGKYSWKQIFNYDIKGQINDRTVNRFISRGALEFLNAKSREVKTISSIEGKWGAMDMATYAALKTASFPLAGYTYLKRALMWLVMGGPSGPAAYTVNVMGGHWEPLSNGPIQQAGLWWKGREWKRLLKDPLSFKSTTLSDDEVLNIYNFLSALSLRKSNLLNISLEAAGVAGTDILEAPGENAGWLTKRKAQWKFVKNYWEQASGYKSYQDQLKQLQEVQLTTTDFVALNEARIQEAKLKRLWRGKVLNYIKEIPNFNTANENEIDEAVNTVIARDTLMRQAGTIQPTDMPSQIGATRGDFTKYLFTKGMKWLYKNPITGVGLMGNAESVRINTLYVAFMTARSYGRTTQESWQHAINYLAATQADYGKASKQFGANTKVGQAHMQYTHYTFNQYRTLTTAFRDLIPQLIEHAPSGAFNKFKFIFESKIKWADKMMDQALHSESFKLQDMNILHILVVKISLMLGMLQLGHRLFPGIIGWQNPVVQLFYTGLNQLITAIGALITSDDDDDKKAGLDILDTIAQQQPFVGLFFKQLASVPLTSLRESVEKPYGNRDIWNAAEKVFLSGRTLQKLDFLTRAYNTVLSAKEEEHLESILSWVPGDATKKTKKKTLLDHEAAFKSMTGLNLFGWTPTADSPKDFWVDDPLRGRTRINIKDNIHLPPGRKGMGEESRILQLVNPKSYVPLLDRILGP